jgi:hypothetical protein
MYLSCWPDSSCNNVCDPSPQTIPNAKRRLPSRMRPSSRQRTNAGFLASRSRAMRSSTMQRSTPQCTAVHVPHALCRACAAPLRTTTCARHASRSRATHSSTMQRSTPQSTTVRVPRALHRACAAPLRTTMCARYMPPSACFVPSAPLSRRTRAVCSSLSRACIAWTAPSHCST